jgi:hypothetical protein
MNGKMKIKPNVTWASGLCLARTSLLLILICAASISCTRSKGPQIQVNPNGSGLPMSQKFSRAYCSMDELGDYQFVLIADGNESLPRGQGKILYPTNSTSLRQVVYIRVLWKPLRPRRADQPTSTNATINWYVRSNMPDRRQRQTGLRRGRFRRVYPTKSRRSTSPSATRPGRPTTKRRVQFTRSPRQAQPQRQLRTLRFAMTGLVRDIHASSHDTPGLRCGMKAFRRVSLFSCLPGSRI